MKQYLDSLKLILDEGQLVQNRTGVSAYTYPHIMIRHNMADGFPLITTKKMAWKSIKVELEFFIKGLRDKKWLQERGCHIWDEWANPKKVKERLLLRYAEQDSIHEYEEKEWLKQEQKEESDLGKTYGVQWRDFNSQGVDQLKWVVDQLKINPNNRQLVVSAWNPCQINEMALPPCHILHHVLVMGGKLNLCWFQRSCDQFLGIPFNFASYGLLLHLYCMETGYEPGILTGFLSNAHIYENHLEAVEEQLKRKPYLLPNVKTDKFTSIFDWTYEDTIIENYKCYPSIKAEIAV
jgi:thymidylate synthase